MPVIGHAFVGVGTALYTRPRGAGLVADRGAGAYWMPALLVLAYLPDVVSQTALLSGWAGSRILGHSLLFALLASLLLGPLLGRVMGGSARRGVLVVLGSVVGHDALDLLQSADRMPLWPFSSIVVGPASPLIPDRMAWEGALFGALFVAAWGLCRPLTGESPWRIVDDPHESPHWRKRLRLGWAFAAVVCAGAVVTNVVRNQRERQMNEAFLLVESGRYDDGLARLEAAQRFPGPGRRGRIDYLRAEAARGQGDRARAEELYLRSYAADPSYFWLVGDLAVFYAEGKEPLAERRRKAAPFRERLIREFPEHRDLPAFLARIERKLAPGNTETDAQPKP